MTTEKVELVSGKTRWVSRNPELEKKLLKEAKERLTILEGTVTN